MDFWFLFLSPTLDILFCLRGRGGLDQNHRSMDESPPFE